MNKLGILTKTIIIYYYYFCKLSVKLVQQQYRCYKQTHLWCPTSDSKMTSACMVWNICSCFSGVKAMAQPGVVCAGSGLALMQRTLWEGLVLAENPFSRVVSGTETFYVVRAQPHTVATGGRACWGERLGVFGLVFGWTQESDSFLLDHVKASQSDEGPQSVLSMTVSSCQPRWKGRHTVIAPWSSQSPLSSPVSHSPASRTSSSTDPAEKSCFV